MIKIIIRFIIKYIFFYISTIFIFLLLKKFFYGLKNEYNIFYAKNIYKFLDKIEFITFLKLNLDNINEYVSLYINILYRKYIDYISISLVIYFSVVTIVNQSS